MRQRAVSPVPLASTRALRQAVLRPHESLAELASHEPQGAFAVAVREGEDLISVGFVAPDGEPGAWRVRGMATAPGSRGAGAGTAVLRALVRHALDAGATRLWCNARIPARSLYERAGFRLVSGEFEIAGAGPHVVMELRATEVTLGPVGD